MRHEDASETLAGREMAMKEAARKEAFRKLAVTDTDANKEDAQKDDLEEGSETTSRTSQEAVYNGHTEQEYKEVESLKDSKKYGKSLKKSIDNGQFENKDVAEK